MSERDRKGTNPGDIRPSGGCDGRSDYFREEERGDEKRRNADGAFYGMSAGVGSAGPAGPGYRRGEGSRRDARDEDGGARKDGRQDLRREDRTLANRGASRGHEGADGKGACFGEDEGHDEEHAPHCVFPRGPGREKACYRGKGDGGGHRPRQEGSDVQPDGDGGTLRRGHHPGQAGEIRVCRRDRGRRKESVHEVRTRSQVANPASDVWHERGLEGTGNHGNKTVDLPGRAARFPGICRPPSDSWLAVLLA